MRRRITVLAATLMFGVSTALVAAPAHAVVHPTPSWRICPPQCIV